MAQIYRPYLQHSVFSFAAHNNSEKQYRKLPGLPTLRVSQNVGTTGSMINQNSQNLGSNNYDSQQSLHNSRNQLSFQDAQNYSSYNRLNFPETHKLQTDHLRTTDPYSL